jgi:hypothetical protein
MTPIVISATGSSPDLTLYEWSTGGGRSGGTAVAPVLANVKLASKAFAGQKGTKLTLSLSEAATVTAVLTESVSGHRVKGRCDTHAKRGPRCTALVTKATARFAGKVGLNVFTLRLRHVAPGRYTLTIRASAGGKVSTVKTFTIRLRAAGHR